MTIIAAIRADLETSDIGTRSRLADELGGVPILRRTVDRLSRVRSVSTIYVLCPAGQAERCRRLLEGTRAVVREFAFTPSPWRSLVRSARKWSLDGWRGGIGGTTYFDEFTDLALLCSLVSAEKADAVLSIPAAAPLLAPEIAEDMIRHRAAAGEQARLVFTAAVPGLAGILLDAGLIGELVEKGVPVGAMFSYKPDAPRKDLIFQQCSLDLPAELRFAAGRLVADSDRAMERIASVMRQCPEGDGRQLGQWLIQRDDSYVEPMPREVEIELTTDDPYPQTLLRPRGSAVGRRGPMDLRWFARVATELQSFDDSLLVLGGFGDPLRHPDFPAVLRLVRPAGGVPGVFGLAIKTAGVDLTDAAAEDILAARVDVLSLTLDAWAPPTYARLHSPTDTAKADLEATLGRAQRLTDRRLAAQSVVPILVPEFCKARENVEEMDAFYDGWLRRNGAASITGYSHYGAQLTDRGVIDMRPPVRTACRRIRSRCTILADGSVVVCDQDFRGRVVVGSVIRQSLREVWQGEAMQRIRQAHQKQDWEATELCATCEEWHRP